MEVVNGYVCKNCTDVEYAKKGVDPAHPKDGPDGIYKADKTGKTVKADGVRAAEDAQPAAYGPAVKFDGALVAVAPPGKPQADPYAPGKLADLRA